MNLSRKGANWTGCCPFHQEKTPSFHVTPAKSNFYCFGCQAGGDVFKFVMESRGVSFRDAVQIVAESCGMSLPEGKSARSKADRAVRELTVEPEPAFAEEYDL